MIYVILYALAALVYALWLMRKSYEFPLSSAEINALLLSAYDRKRGIWQTAYGWSAYAGARMFLTDRQLLRIGRRAWILLMDLNARATARLSSGRWAVFQSYWEITENKPEPLTRSEAADLLNQRQETLIRWPGLRVFCCRGGRVLLVCHTGRCEPDPDQYLL